MQNKKGEAFWTAKRLGGGEGGRGVNSSFFRRVITCHVFPSFFLLHFNLSRQRKTWCIDVLYREEVDRTHNSLLMPPLYACRSKAENRPSTGNNGRLWSHMHTLYGPSVGRKINEYQHEQNEETHKAHGTERMYAPCQPRVFLTSRQAQRVFIRRVRR